MQTHDTNVFDEFDDSYLAPSYNVAPQSFQPVVRLSPETGNRELTVMRWGLVPFWSKDGKASFSTINAKSETVATSPAFREAWKQRRCLVPADWFYEWEKLDEKNKQPFAIANKERDYERWLAPTDPANLPIDLLRPYPADEMKAWNIGEAVGNTRNNDPSLIEPLKDEEVAAPLRLFG
jgi:putative SOS response-associated peptidase YedK